MTRGALRRFAVRLQCLSLRTQLLAAVGVVVVLGASIALAGYMSLRNLQAGMETMLVRTSQLREAGLQVQKAFLLVRVSEQAFLQEWHTAGLQPAVEEHVTALRLRLKEARAQLASIRAHATGVDERREFEAVSDQLAVLFDGYETGFNEALQKIAMRAAGDGLETDLRTRVGAIAAMAERTGDRRLQELVGAAPRVLVVLPKWWGVTSTAHPGWLADVELLPLDEIARTLEEEFRMRGIQAQPFAIDAAMIRAVLDWEDDFLGFAGIARAES